MMNIKGIFAVSLIAMVAVVAGAHTSNAVAAIASKGYVDEQVGSKLSSISGSTTGSGNVVTSVSASGSTVSATKGITAEETKNKVTSVRAAASATDTAYPSEKAVATALAGKANTSALSGYATTTALSAVEDKAEAAQSAASAAQTAADDAADAASAAQSTASGKLSSISGSTSGTGNVVTSVSASGSTVSATKGITAEETKNKVTSVSAVASATDTAYPSEKAVATALAGKEVTSNKVTSANYAANVSNDTKYPTVKAVADNIHNATLTIKKNGTSVGTFTANASVDKDINIEVPEATTASDILTATTVTSSGTGAVLTGVSVTAGKVTLQKGNVQIPSGGQNATSYVSIWVE